MKKKDLVVKMTRKAFVKEHKHLLKVLKTHKGEKEEYKDQSKELSKYYPHSNKVENK